jgi:ABC-type Fe3+-citrate transport system substrate-binding protein
MSDQYGEAEQYQKMITMETRLKDHEKILLKTRKSFKKKISDIKKTSSKDHYLEMAENQEMVKKAVYKMIITGLFVIAVGIAGALLLYFL